MNKAIIQEAMKGSREPKALLQQIAISSMQDKAATEFVTDAPLPPTIESFWKASSYAGKKYPVRFVARVVTQWINTYVQSYSISPEERNVLDNRIYALLEEINHE